MDFFAELEKLREKSPRIGGIIINSENCDYTYNVDRGKNCYLIANAVDNEDCLYGRDLYHNKDCVDCDHIEGCTLCYECLNCRTCYNSHFLQDSENALDCHFGYDLKNCQNCTGCVNLRNKQYCIFNEPYAKADYFEKLKTFTRDEIRKKFEELKLRHPRIYAHQLGSENFSGNYVYHSQNVHQGFDVENCQDIGYIIEGKDLKDCWDISVLEYSELCYEISSCYKLNNCHFCYFCWQSSDLEYCDLVANSQYCFGCVGVNHKKFHILNQSYEKDDYFKKVAEIKDELKKRNEYNRRFFVSPYPLEDTVALWSRM